MINEAELRRMTHNERRELARSLAAIDLPHPLLDPRLRRRRTLALLVMTVSCAGLAGWIAILVLTLPGRYTSSDWRAVWVGLDIAELLGFAATAWAAWRQRQIVIFFMIITGTLLLCDAWVPLFADGRAECLPARLRPGPGDRQNAGVTVAGRPLADQRRAEKGVTPVCRAAS